jgi:hypothetical protein
MRGSGGSMCSCYSTAAGGQPRGGQQGHGPAARMHTSHTVLLLREEPQACFAGFDTVLLQPCMLHAGMAGALSPGAHIVWCLQAASGMV